MSVKGNKPRPRHTGKRTEVERIGSDYIPRPYREGLVGLVAAEVSLGALFGIEIRDAASAVLKAAASVREPER